MEAQDWFLLFIILAIILLGTVYFCFIQDNDADFGDYDIDEPEFNEQSDEDDWGSNKKKRKRGGGVGGVPAVLGRPPKRLAAGISNSGGSTPIVLKIAKTGEIDSPGYLGSSIGGNEDRAAPPPPAPDIRPFVCQCWFFY